MNLLLFLFTTLIGTICVNAYYEMSRIYQGCLSALLTWVMFFTIVLNGWFLYSWVGLLAAPVLFGCWFFLMRYLYWKYLGLRGFGIFWLLQYYAYLWATPLFLVMTVMNYLA